MTAPAAERPTHTAPRTPLPRRPRPAGPAATYLAEAHAAYLAAALNLPIPTGSWRAMPDGTVHARLADGTTVRHTGLGLQVAIPCREGATHTHLIGSLADLKAARTSAVLCTTLHDPFSPDLPCLGRPYTGQPTAETAITRVLPLHQRTPEHP